MAADQNIRFLIHLKSLAGHPAGYRAAHVRVSDLPADRRTRDNLSRAIGLLAEIKNRHKSGEIFLLRNADILFIGNRLPRGALENACRAIVSVFMGDSQTPETTGAYTIYDLETDFAALMNWAEQAAGLGSLAQPASEPKGDIDLAGLGRVKEELRRIDISTMLFSQPAYDISARQVEIVFVETYVSVLALEEMLCPGLSLTSRRWLFTDLTEEMDSAVLQFLMNAERATWSRRLSVNVNLSTLASPRFAEFDTEIAAERRQNVILEINKTDIFENMRLYRELVPYLRQRGYRLLLDGLSFLNVAAIDFAGLDCDFAKVFWSAEASALDAQTMGRITAKFHAKNGPRFLLARCDSAESVRFARSVGIDVTQGRLIDHMVRRNVPL